MDEERAAPQPEDVQPSKQHEDGSGEDSMHSFVKGAITGILLPFVENLQELHHNVAQLSSSLADTNTKAEQALETNAEHATLLGGLRADLESTGTEVGRAHSRLNGVDEAKVALELDIGKVALRVRATEERLTACEAVHAELQASLKSARQAISRLSDSITSGQIDMQKRVNPTLDKLSAGVASLDAAQRATQRELEGTKAIAEGIHTDLQNRMQEVQAKRSEDLQRMDRMEDNTAKLGISLQEASATLTAQGEKLQTATTGLATVRKHVDTLETNMQESQKRINATEVDITDLKVQCRGFETNLKKINDFLWPPDGGNNIWKVTADLRRDLEKQGTEIVELRNMDSTQAGQLRDAEDANGKVAGRATKLEEKVARLEVRLGIDEPPEPERKSEIAPGRVAPFAAPMESSAAPGAGTGSQSARMAPTMGHAQVSSPPPLGRLTPIAAPAESSPPVLDGGAAGASSARGPPTMPPLAQVPEGGSGASSARGAPVMAPLSQAMLGSPPPPSSSAMAMDMKLAIKKPPGVGAAMLRSAVEKMSVIAAQRAQKRMLEDSCRKLDEHSDHLQKHAHRHDIADGRFDDIETKLMGVADQLRNLSKGMNLSQEYWKGLSKGLKDISYKGDKEGSASPSLKGEYGWQATMRLPTLGRPQPT